MTSSSKLNFSNSIAPQTYNKKIMYESMDSYTSVIKYDSSALEIFVNHTSISRKKFYAKFVNDDLENLIPKWKGSTFDEKIMIIENDIKSKSNFIFSDDYRQINLGINFVYGAKRYPGTLKLNLSISKDQTMIKKELLNLEKLVIEKRETLNSLKLVNTNIGMILTNTLDHFKNLLTRISQI